MKEDWKKETIKAVLFVLLILVVGTLTVLLTDNSILLIISGMLIGTVDKIFDKWLDENWREEWYIVKEKINKIGLLNYVFWKLLCIIELILNVPYYILKIIIEIIYSIFDKLNDIFYEQQFVYLTWFKPIRKYFEYLRKRIV